MSPKQEAYYWRMWTNVCGTQGWERIDDEKRHAIHLQALGKDVSHKLFSNRDFDRVLAVMQVLSKPDSLEARMTLDRYEEQSTKKEDPGERRRLIFSIDHKSDAMGGDAYVTAISREMFQTRLWRDLPISSLTILRDTITNRFRAYQKRTEIDQVTAPAGADCPF